jgi:hypothetical protein
VRDGTNLRVSRAGLARSAAMDSAGINRQEAGDERSLRERSSDPLGPEFCAGRREVHSEA